MHDFTTFEKTIPLYDDNDPIRKHLKKFKCCVCNKNKFHIPFDTVDGKTVCMNCIKIGPGQNIVLNDRTIRDLEAVADRINGTDNYPPKAERENKKDEWKAFKRKLFWKYAVPDLAPFIAMGLGTLIVLLFRLVFA